jgi:hypothetical protein
VFEIAFFIVISLIAALLITGVSECVATGHAVADVDFGHHAAEIFGVVRQSVQIGFIEIENSARRI